MIEKIVGNKTAEKALLHIYHNHESYASLIASDFGIAITPVAKQLDRFESAGILFSKTYGKTRVYFFNEKSPFTKPLKELVKIVYENIQPKEKEQIFKTRTRPRRKGKPVYGRT